MKDEKILITGGNGFIGTKLCEFFTKRHLEFIAPKKEELNLECYNSTIKYLEELRSNSIEVKTIIHLAAIYKSRDWSTKNNYKCLLRNSMIHTNLFTAVDKIFSNAKIISTLSYTIYNIQRLNIKESEIETKSKEDNDLLGYMLSKQINLHFSNFRNKDCGEFNSICVILPTVYTSPEFMGTNTFVGEVYSKMKIAKKTNTKLELSGSGREVREFLDLEDLCESLLKLIKFKSPKYSIYNLGSGNKVTIEEFIKTMALKYNFSNEIKFLSLKKKDDQIGLDSTRFQDEFNMNFKKLLA